MKYIFGDYGIKKDEYLNYKPNNKIISKALEVVLHDHLALGHEIHVSRILIFDLLNKNFISTKDTLILREPDRHFLYSSTFANIITYKQFCELENINEKSIIYVTMLTRNILGTLPDTNFSSIYMQNIENYNIHNDSYWNDKMIKMIKKIPKYNFKDQLEEILKNKYIIFIVRSHDLSQSTIKNPNINNFYLKLNNNIKDLKEKEKFKTYKLILYCQNNNVISNLNTENVDYISQNLEEYTNLLKHHNCKYLIGDQSGGLEISYYFHNNDLTVLTFIETYHWIKTPCDFIENTTDMINRQGFKHNIKAIWNQKYIPPFKEYRRKNFEDLLV